MPFSSVKFRPFSFRFSPTAVLPIVLTSMSMTTEDVYDLYLNFRVAGFLLHFHFASYQLVHQKGKRFDGLLSERQIKACFSHTFIQASMSVDARVHTRSHQLNDTQPI